MIVRTYILSLCCTLGMVVTGYAQQQCLGPLTVIVRGAETAQPIVIEGETSDVYCTEGEEGEIYLRLYGGTPKYQCQWSHDTTTADIATELPPGSYSVTVTDSHGCTQEKSISIVQVDPLLDSLDLLSASACGDCYLHDGTQSYFYFDDEYIAAIIDLETTRDMGRTRVCADIEDYTQYYYGDPILQRCWTVESEVSEQSDYRLFFSREEFDVLALEIGYPTGEHLVSSGNLYVNYFELQPDQTFSPVPIDLLYGDFTITKFDAEKEVWSLELYDLPNAKIQLLSRPGVLPLELLSFDGEVMKGYNQLSWHTQHEINIEHFIIEKSLDGIGFDSIGMATAGRSQYAYRDYDQWQGPQYYRLKILDLDGQYRYSHIVRLVLGYSFDFDVVNNPFTDKLFVEVTSGYELDARLTVVAVNGQVVFERPYFIEAGTTEIEMDLSRLSSGNYIVTLHHTNSIEMISRKVVKI